MNLDFIGLLNRQVPGDPQITRIVIVCFVMIAAFGWARDVRRRWRGWDPGIRRNAMWLTAVLVTNGAGLLAAADRDDPLRVITWVLGFNFIGLSLSLLTPAHKKLLNLF